MSQFLICTVGWKGKKSCALCDQAWSRTQHKVSFLSWDSTCLAVAPRDARYPRKISGVGRVYRVDSYRLHLFLLIMSKEIFSWKKHSFVFFHFMTLALKKNGVPLTVKLDLRTFFHIPFIAMFAILSWCPTVQDCRLLLRIVFFEVYTYQKLAGS